MEGVIPSVRKAVKEFNKYRSPEATAKLISVKGKSIKLEFSGVFCKTCGFYDYFDDFIIMLEEYGIKASRLSVRESDNSAIVEFGIK